jgi:hypothetical protein
MTTPDIIINQSGQPSGKYYMSLSKAYSKSNSLQTTIPMSIINQFGFKVDEMLLWKIAPGNNNLIIKIKSIRKV